MPTEGEERYERSLRVLLMRKGTKAEHDEGLRRQTCEATGCERPVDARVSATWSIADFMDVWMCAEHATGEAQWLSQRWVDGVPPIVGIHWLFDWD